MKVLLAGYNLDSEVIDALVKNSPPRLDITPETLSAAYARISRDPRPVNELRAEARKEVERARRSNQTIIFKMGHHSVAEHAVFNFDIIGVSRLAIEAIEHFRLASFTEKSQRYVKLGGEVVVPEEIRQAGREKEFLALTRRQHELYQSLYERLRPYFFERFEPYASDPKNQVILDNWAKEDARYVLSLSTQSQLGMTVNARTLELMIRRFAGARLAELRTLGKRLYELASKVAPSLLLFTEASPYEVSTYDDLLNASQPLIEKKIKWEKIKKGEKSRKTRQETVRLINLTPGGDDYLLAALLHRILPLSFEDCQRITRRLKPEEKRKLFLTSFRRLEFYDRLLREFEHTDLAFELVVSASCFAQLKRHRLATLTCQPYDPSLGVTVPPSIRSIGASREFLAIMKEAENLYEQLKPAGIDVASYALTNAHRRRVLFKANVRELYHISRLRQDQSAQWDIRNIVGEMIKLARQAMPLAFLLAGGKDAFPGLYARLFGQEPQMKPPALLRPASESKEEK